jgi:beta-phosphoglucomutase-like phosphatase (HAD superfamily)
MLDAILCEFEGVLADTAPLRRAALRTSLAEEGVALHDDQSAEAFRDHELASLPVPTAARGAR